MLCFVYKSPRKSDTYVYLRERDGFGVLPEALTATLGTLVFVMELELSPTRKLAREDTAKVIESLCERGFHLQLPPPPDAPMSASAT
jgi:uncharacterized protein YcgL (UPF0745 family)